MSCLLAFNVSLGQIPASYHYHTENGMPSNTVYSICKDSRSMIWLGTELGLFKFDGIRFISIKSNAQQSNSITGLNLSKKGRMYCYNFKKQVFYIEHDSMHLMQWDKRVSGMTCDKKGNVWVASQDGLHVFNEYTNQWTAFEPVRFGLEEDAFHFAKSLQFDDVGNLYFLCSAGLVMYDGKQAKVYQVDFRRSSVQAIGTYVLSTGRSGIWLIPQQEGRFYKLVNEALTPYDIPNLTDALKGTKITEVIDYNDGTMAFSTFGGIILYHYDRGVVEKYFPEISFSHSYRDGSGYTWCTSLTNGMYYVRDFNSPVWTIPGSSKKISKVLFDAPQVVFALELGEIGFFNTLNNQFKQINLAKKSDITALFIDPDDGRLFIGCNNYLFIYDKGKVTEVNTMFPPMKKIYHKDGNLFICSSIGSQWFKLKGNQVAVKQQLSTDWGRDLVVDESRGWYWLATNNGLLKYSYSPQGDSLVLKDTLMSGILINSLSNDEQNKHVFGVNYKGHVFQVNEKNTLKLLDSLPSGCIPQQISYQTGHLYFATNKGLWDYKLQTGKWRVQDRFTGLSSNEIRALSFQGDSIWLATSVGLQRVSKAMNEGNKPIELLFKYAMVGDQLLLQPDAINLGYKQPLRFKIDALAYSSNGQYKLAYRLLGHDNRWMYLPPSIEEIVIPTLPSGYFTIEVKAVDYWGNDSANVIQLKGYSAPPYWQRWWFLVLCGLALLGTGYGLFKARIKVMEQRQAKELERIQLENDLRFSQQTALKAQMNPHFLFNVLNSIKSYIYDNDRRNAVLYLSSFSDLVRKILEMSSLPAVKLAQEIEVLQLYIELEAMLLQTDFQHSISLPEDIDINEIEIPSLLIQPYIENAFKHGLRHKEGAKFLALNFSVDRERSILQIQIKDNGVGRLAAQRINNDHRPSHQQFATSANEKRIDLLNFKQEGLVGIEIIDEIAENGQPSGTTVTLKIDIHGQV
jgi:ligand-binding sensor domain-containing protein